MWFIADDALIVLHVCVVKHMFVDDGEVGMLGNVRIGMVAEMACMVVCSIR